MEIVPSAERHIKLSRYWSERKESEITLRVSYSVHEDAGCRIYEVETVEEIGA